MAVDKLVDSTQLDADLTSVANAIRTKGGTSAQLAFPAGFVSAIEDIETGGGNEQLYKSLIERNASGAITISGIIRLGTRSLDSVSASVTSLHFTDLTTIAGSYSIANNSHLQSVVVEPALTINSSEMLYKCTALQSVDLTPNKIANYTFEGCTVLTTIILRSASVATLASTNAFNGTPFKSGGSGGTLYVPSTLISSYQSATYWSTILGYTNNQILPIEGSIYETQYADGTPIT